MEQQRNNGVNFELGSLKWETTPSIWDCVSSIQRGQREVWTVYPQPKEHGAEFEVWFLS